MSDYFSKILPKCNTNAAEPLSCERRDMCGRRGATLKHRRVKPVEWAAHLVHLDHLGLLLFPADTKKPHNEMKAQKWVAGLPTHRP